MYGSPYTLASTPVLPGFVYENIVGKRRGLSLRGSENGEEEFLEDEDLNQGWGVNTFLTTASDPSTKELLVGKKMMLLKKWSEEELDITVDSHKVGKIKKTWEESSENMEASVEGKKVAGDEGGGEAVEHADEDTISSDSLHSALETLGLNPSPEEVAALLAEIGVEDGQAITRAQFHQMVEQNAEHDIGLHAVAEVTEDDATESTSSGVEVRKDLKRLKSKPSVAMIEPNKIGAHSDMYWAEFRKEDWPAFPEGFRIDAHNFVLEATVPGSSESRQIREGDVLLMIDAQKVDKRLPPEAIVTAIQNRMETNGTVNLKLRRSKDHNEYTGEYFVALHEVPSMGEIKDCIVCGPIPPNSLADHEGIQAGDTLLAINNEAVSEFKLGTIKFKSLCDAAMLRDGSLILHLRHAEHNIEPHHSALHPVVHKAGFLLCGGGCCNSGRNPTDEVEENDMIHSLADAV
eukprot:g1529.t1